MFLRRIVYRLASYPRKFFLYIKNIWLNTICSSPIVPIGVRRLLLHLCGHNVSKVFSNCFFGEGPGHLYIGKGSFVNHGCFFDLGGDITIGDNCAIAMNVSFINGTHEILHNDTKIWGGQFCEPIVVKNGCWLCANSVILPGVTIGEGTIIAAGSVVINNCEPFCLYAGVPAKKIKELKNN